MLKISPDQVNDLIKKRRSIFPKSYIQKPIPKEIIHQILENANWAPNHKLTEPWRFKVYRGEAKNNLGRILSNTYKEQTSPDKFSEMKFKKLSKNPTLADTIIAIVMQRDPKESLPEWEEIAAIGCAVQNMYLTCTAYNIGAYWSSPGLIKFMDQPLGLKEGERCLGFFYMGYHEMPAIDGMRKPIEEKVDWIE